jgi:prepilin-type N-terminal cleavage/methylation domain-containing protein
MTRSPLLARRGFTLVEVLVASALLGASLIVMFGFHSQAVRANMNARRLTDCTYLAQAQMERLLSLTWTDAAGRPTDLQADFGVASDPTSLGMWDDFEHPGGTITPVNAANSTDESLGPALYTVSWDVENLDSDETWVRLRVRCTYADPTFDTSHGTTISSYRFTDG